MFDLQIAAHSAWRQHSHGDCLLGFLGEGMQLVAQPAPHAVTRRPLCATAASLGHRRCALPCLPAFATSPALACTTSRVAPLPTASILTSTALLRVLTLLCISFSVRGGCRVAGGRPRRAAPALLLCVHHPLQLQALVHRQQHAHPRVLASRDPASRSPMPLLPHHACSQWYCSGGNQCGHDVHIREHTRQRAGVMNSGLDCSRCSMRSTTTSRAGQLAGAAMQASQACPPRTLRTR